MSWDIISAHATGSRYICNPAPTDTDNDIVVLLGPYQLYDYVAGMVDSGYEIGGSLHISEGQAYTGYDGFVSLKKGEINLIVTECVEFYGKFVQATEEAKALNLLCKAARIELFQRVLYGA